MHWRESAVWQSQLLRQTMPRPAQRRRVRPAVQYRGLPSYTGGNRAMGATLVNDGSVYPEMAVQGSKTIKVRPRQKGGVQTVVRREMQHMDMLNDKDFIALKRLFLLPGKTAERLSQGNMSDAVRKTHPYAQGTRRAVGRLRGSGRGVSNMAIVNKISGEFADNWGTFARRDEGGITFYLSNKKRYARYLAFGTRKMKSHGPFATAVVMHLPAIDAEWRRLARLASARYNAQQQAAGGVR